MSSISRCGGAEGEEEQSHARRRLCGGTAAAHSVLHGDAGLRARSRGEGGEEKRGEAWDA